MGDLQEPAYRPCWRCGFQFSRKTRHCPKCDSKQKIKLKNIIRARNLMTNQSQNLFPFMLPNRSPRAPRSSLEISLAILRTIDENPSNQTRITYSNHIGWRTFRSHIESLMEQGLVEVDEDPLYKLYVATEKGRAVLRDFARGGSSERIFSIIT